MEYKCINYTNHFLKILHCVAESDFLYGTLSTDDLPDAQRNFKDTVFRMLFRRKKALLSLYNAVNKTNIIGSLQTSKGICAIYGENPRKPQDYGFEHSS